MKKLGIVTYQIAKDWDLETLLQKTAELGLAGVELRTTHAHGVELPLTQEERAEVKRKFADTPVKLVGLGSVYDYHSPDPAILAQNIEGTKEYIILAEAVGAEGVKVRPNKLPADVPRERTIEQIGKALREAGAFAMEHGVKIRLEVHGQQSSHPPYIRQMLDIADHPNVYACWNCNKTDLDENGSIDSHFEMLKDKIELVHMHRLHDAYPYKRLFALLNRTGYDGFHLAEIPPSSDPDEVLLYYKTLFDLMYHACSR